MTDESSVRTPKALPDGVSQATVGVRGGMLRSGFEETAEAMYLTSGYVYGSAAVAEKSFAGELDHYVLPLRQPNGVGVRGAAAADRGCPGGVRHRQWHGRGIHLAGRAAGCRRPTGCRAQPVWLVFRGVQRDPAALGVQTVFVDGDDLAMGAGAFGTHAGRVLRDAVNPMQSLVDIAAVTELAHAAGAKVVLDNVFATPLLQQGFPLGVDVVVYSGTKHIDGQGRVLGGAILGDREYIDGPVQKLMRHTGPAMSAFNAWVLLKGLETLAIRVQHSNASAQRIAEFLNGHPSVRWVRYPYLPSHPQYDLAKRQMSGGGTVVTFALDCPEDVAKQRAFEVLDKMRLIDISNNLGDAKSLVTHPATTTHRAMGPEGRAAIGLGDGVVRISVGLEDTDDLIADIDRALS